MSRSASASDLPPAKDAVGAMQQMLDQMDRFFQSDFDERKKRLQQLEQRQEQLQALVEAGPDATAASDAAASANSTGRFPPPPANAPAVPRAKVKLAPSPIIQREVKDLTEQCTDSMSDLLIECKAATAENQRLRHMNEQLSQRLVDANDKTAALTAKMEQLARNVVKALRERNQLEEGAVRAQKERNAAVKSLEKFNATHAELEALQKENPILLGNIEALQRDLLDVKDENRRLRADHEDHVLEARKFKRQLSDDRHATSRDLVQQITDVTAERDSLATALVKAESINNRLADELQACILHTNVLEERVEAVSRDLTAERQQRIAREREYFTLKAEMQCAEGELAMAKGAGSHNTSYQHEYSQHSLLGGSGTRGGGYGGGATNEGLEMERRHLLREIGRLQGDMEAMTLDHADRIRIAEENVRQTTSMYTQITERCREMEDQLSGVKNEVIALTKDKTNLQVLQHHYMHLLRGILQDAEGALSQRSRSPIYDRSPPTSPEGLQRDRAMLQKEVAALCEALTGIVLTVQALDQAKKEVALGEREKSNFRINGTSPQENAFSTRVASLSGAQPPLARVPLMGGLHHPGREGSRSASARTLVSPAD